MRIVEGRVRIGVDGADSTEPGAFPSLGAFLEALSSIGKTHDVVLQAFDGSYVAGPEHLDAAVAHARRAIERGEAVADEQAVEILLYAAGRRQIDRAMAMGVGEGEQGVAVVIVGGGEPGETSDGSKARARAVTEAAAEAERGAAAAVDDLLAPGPVEPDPERIQSFFDITDAERRATDADLEALVVERVALLDVEK